MVCTEDCWNLIAKLETKWPLYAKLQKGESVYNGYDLNWHCTILKLF